MVRNKNLIKLDGSEYMWNGSFWYNTKTFAVPSSIVSFNLTKELSKKLGLKPNLKPESSYRH